jgi:trans-2,3-dihydro-3-hydroxyanthranilate isomerase
MARFAFHTLDVFTDKALAGNPLAIVHAADALDTAQMQAITREFNLSETVFVLKPTNPAHNARLRIFTPAKELPFAGHPTVGTAVLLAEAKFGTEDERDAIVVLEEGVGIVRCGVKIVPGKATYAEFDVPKVAQETGKPALREKLALALGLTPSDIGFDNHKPSVYSAGVDFTFIPVRDRDALHRATPILPAWNEAMPAGFRSAYVYTRLPEDSRHAFRARMFSPEMGILEDPATGAAAAAFAGVLARFEPLADGHHVLPVEQGVEMGRPSLVTVEVEMEAGRLAASRIGGAAVVISEGTLTI